MPSRWLSIDCWWTVDVVTSNEVGRQCASIPLFVAPSVAGGEQQPIPRPIAFALMRDPTKDGVWSEMRIFHTDKRVFDSPVTVRQRPSTVHDNSMTHMQNHAVQVHVAAGQNQASALTQAERAGNHDNEGEPIMHRVREFTNLPRHDNEWLIAGHRSG